MTEATRGLTVINWTVELNHVGCQHIVQLRMTTTLHAAAIQRVGLFPGSHHESALSCGQWWLAEQMRPHVWLRVL